MAKTMHVDVVSSEKELFAGEALMLIAPAVEGEVGIMPGHAQMLCLLKPGLVKVKLDGEAEEQTIYVSGGILEVQPESVTILSDTAERARDLDEAAALEAKKAAEQAMASHTEEMDYARAQAELAEAMAQLRIIQSMRKNARK